MDTILLRFFILVFFYVFLFHNDSRTDGFLIFIINLVKAPICYIKKLVSKFTKNKNPDKKDHDFKKL